MKILDLAELLPLQEGMKSHVLRLVGGSHSRHTAERSKEQRFRFPAQAEEVSEISCHPARKDTRRDPARARDQRRAS